MRTRTKHRVGFCALAASLLLAGSQAWAEERPAGESGYQNSWYRVAAGGITFTTGSGYEIVGTIGQWDTPSPAFIGGGNYAIQSGYWAAALQPLSDALFSDRFESASPPQVDGQRSRIQR